MRYHRGAGSHGRLCLLKSGIGMAHRKHDPTRDELWNQGHHVPLLGSGGDVSDIFEVGWTVALLDIGPGLCFPQHFGVMNSIPKRRQEWAFDMCAQTLAALTRVSILS